MENATFQHVSSEDITAELSPTVLNYYAELPMPHLCNLRVMLDFHKSSITLRQFMVTTKPVLIYSSYTSQSSRHMKVVVITLILHFPILSRLPLLSIPAAVNNPSKFQLSILPSLLSSAPSSLLPNLATRARSASIMLSFRSFQNFICTSFWATRVFSDMMNSENRITMLFFIIKKTSRFYC